MILATHALTGAVIGKNIESPVLIIILSLAVHFIMDGLRHGEYFDSRVATTKDTWWKVALDLSAGLLLILSAIFFQKLSLTQTINVLLGAFFSTFPDLLTLLFYCKIRLPFLVKIKKFHALCHRYDKFPKYSPERLWTFRNSLNDIIISLLAIILLFLK
ncbi:MAG: hypothetical protein WAV73_03505 [Candidatus Moraniibacteriota bacterium]